MPPSRQPRGFDRPIGNSLLRGTMDKELDDIQSQLEPSTKLQALIDEFLSQAEQAEEAAKGPQKVPLGQRIGFSLNEMVKHGTSIAECLKKWDKNEDGTFSKAEYAHLAAPCNTSPVAE